jgi:hypothetical protein
LEVPGDVRVGRNRHLFVSLLCALAQQHRKLDGVNGIWGLELLWKSKQNKSVFLQQVRNIYRSFLKICVIKWFIGEGLWLILQIRWILSLWRFGYYLESKNK